ncbi:uncharacterized protein Eint_061440 [Encephalitozoon intestinalis ATCC 50506]|uniref:K Homology domain-containing protein n=1 Tax=Encephalitozoon intestinalis (strain ATCC 50506) TaxID=876142 RepID=E0S7S0_ENCIT|nr:uncharacterized protein Eint_061440 [Encephalitozoon intestinalis ATCC 50506]ADM11749.1 hypothetical protein Eint_061440 [Encephalitozoon intestinalis ATCC 50506]UTX45490.1 KH domain-containing protein [Encephalitozoon intestinalis]
MEHRRKGLESFTVPELDGASLSFIIPLGEHTPREMVSSMYNGICLDLHKILVGIGHVSVSKSIGNKVQVSLSMGHPYGIHQMMELASRCFRYCYRLEIPLCLYSMKAEIMERVKEIMSSTDTSICIKISGKVEIFICGKRKACLSARTKILLMIEEAFGRTTEIRRILIPTKEVIEKGGRIFYHSRINSDECLISHSGLGLDIKEPEKIIESLVLDSQKVMYLLLYKGKEIEDILSDTQTYINTRKICSDYTEIVLKGFDLYEVRRAKNKINLLYNNIMKVVMKNMKHLNYDNAFVLHISDTSSFLVISEKQNLLRMVEENGGYVEAEMDIETETVEFLCGKKNGKITRIMRDVCCGIGIHKKPGSSRVHMVINGRSEAFKNALEMIEDEFPEELTFYIDEKHHKRIIGYGGKNIQKIMKKHGVYIKFMNERERKKSAYKDNVVIKTPRKNVENLVSMRNDVMGLIGCFKDDTKGLETEVSLHDFYDLGYPVYRLFYNKAVVRGSEIRTSYYLKDDSYSLNIGPHLTFKLRNSSQWFIKTTEVLPLERISTMHWLKGVERMSAFSWLFGRGYNSLFNSEREERTKGQLHFLEASFLSKK